MTSAYDALQGRINGLEAENARLRARIKELETPDMWWDADGDGDGPMSPDDIAAARYDYFGDDDPPPYVIRTMQARSLPGGFYLVAPVDAADPLARRWTAEAYPTEAEARAALDAAKATTA